MEKRECIKCKEVKDIVEYSKKTKTRYSTKCRVCTNKYDNERRKRKYHEDENYRNELKRKRAERDKLKKSISEEDWKLLKENRKKLKDNDDYRKELNRKRYERMKRKMLIDEEYRKRINRKSTVRKRKKYHNDHVYKLRSHMKTTIKQIIKKRFGAPKSGPTAEILGLCSVEFFNYIESLFQDGMTWDNRSEWHIDHIVPVSVAQTIDEVKYLNHYTNLRPMWGEENISKGDKIDDENIELYNKFLKEMRGIS